MQYNLIKSVEVNMEIQNINKILGKNIRKIRIKSGLSLEKLSELTNIRKEYLEIIENGSAKRITYTIICKLHEVLNTTGDEMFKNIE